MAGVRPNTIGGYVLEQKLGEGGMGAVYRASHPGFPGRRFALKVVLSDGEIGAEQRARFQREMQALARATVHPNVVRIFGGTFEGNAPFYVMELVQGESLAKLAAGAPLAPERAARLVRDLAVAMDHVHHAGVLHRDLKPENVIVEPGDRPRICDFGLARVADAERLTRSGTFLGTPAYAAPEQVDGRVHEVDARADVYSLGAVLSFLLTGHAPFEGPSPTAILKSVLFDLPAHPRRVNPGVPRDLDAACLQALEKDPADRYSTAAELADDLGRFLAGEPVRARTRGPLDELQRRLRSRVARLGARAIAAIVAGTMLVFAAGLLEARRRAGILVEIETRIQESYAASMAPGAGVLEIRNGIAAIATHAARLGREGDPRLEAVRRRLRERELAELTAEVARAGATATSEATLARLATLAVAAPASASLVGELPDAPAILADVFLDAQRVLRAARARNERAESPDGSLAAASKVVEARLALDARDPAARALRAYVALDRLGAPTRALGLGRVGLPGATSREVLEDLAAGGELAGLPGARADWLAVDLLAAAATSPAGLDEARGAFERARRRHDDPALAAAFDRILSGPPDGAGYEPLAARLAQPAEARAAAVELSRFLSRAGLARALEHPHAGWDRSEWDAALALDPPAAFEPVPRDLSEISQEYDRTLKHLADLIKVLRPTPEEERGEDQTLSVAKRLRRRLDRNWKAFLDDFEKATRERPRHPHLLSYMGIPNLDSLATSVPLVLASREMPYQIHLLACAFNSRVRLVSRTGMPDDYFSERVWEGEHPELEGLAAAQDFDRRLADDLATYEPLELLRKGKGVTDAEVASACIVLGGLKRAELLADVTGERPVPAADRPRLVFEAFRGLEEYARLGGPGVLAFRPRLRAIAFPGPLGTELARLDLARLLRVGHAPPQDPRFPLDVGAILRIGAAFAVELGDRALAEDLYHLAVAWIHEDALWTASALAADSSERRQLLAANLGNRSGPQESKHFLLPLAKLYRPEDFKPTVEDERRARNPYKFLAPHLHERARR